MKRTRQAVAAAADFTSAVERDPRNAEAFDLRGLVYTGLGDDDRAIADYEKASAQQAAGDGCDCQSESPLAWEYFEKKEYERLRRESGRDTLERRACDSIPRWSSTASISRPI